MNIKAIPGRLWAGLLSFFFHSIPIGYLVLVGWTSVTAALVVFEVGGESLVARGWLVFTLVMCVEGILKTFDDRNSPRTP